MKTDTKLTVVRQWEHNDWPDELVTGYSHNGKTFRPERVTLTVTRGTASDRYSNSSKITVTGPVLKKNLEPGENWAENEYDTRSYSINPWAARPQWVADLTDPVILEVLEGAPYGLPEVVA